MLQAMADGADPSSQRAAVSAGETLPAPVCQASMARTGKPMPDGIGATGMLNVFLNDRFDGHRPGRTGRLVTGSGARIGDAPGAQRAAGRGRPTGCRSLADDRRRGLYTERLEPEGRLFPTR